MATFLLIEGFDVYPNVSGTAGLESRGWTLPSGGSSGSVFVAGLFGGQAMTMGSGGGNVAGFGYPIYASGSGATDITFGFRFKIVQLASEYPVISLLNGGVNGTMICGIGFNQAQQFYGWRGSNYTGTVLGQTASISTGSWHYVECALHVNNATGTMQVWLDGISAFSFTGNTGNATIDNFMLAGGINTSSILFTVDDLYVITGSTRLGERKVETKYPTANDSVQWTPLTGANWQEVSETLCDGDSSYNDTVTVNNQDTFAMQALSETPGTIDAVQVRNAVRKTDSTAHTYASILKSGATTSTGATYTPGTSYGYDIDIYSTDPNTSSAWTAAGVNAVKAGYKLLT